MKILLAVNPLSLIGLVILLGSLGYFGFSLVRFIKLDLSKTQNYKRYLIEHLITMVGSIVGLLMTFASLLYKIDPLPTKTYLWNALGGGTLFILAIEWFLTAVFIYVYKVYLKNELPDTFIPYLKMTIYVLILPVLVFLFMFLDGIVPLLTFPLPKGIPFNDPLVAFYALFILSGALFVYYMADLRLQKDGHPQGYFENVFLVAFPAGVVGARIWYVIGQWSTEFAGLEWWRPFAIWEGGLAIQGGALFGAIAGVLFVKFYRKDIHIPKVADFVVPSILIAQAIGRWGNFFNQEVYGEVVDVANWLFLPEFLRLQMTVGGQFHVPLFLIEGMVNLTGYFVLIFVIGKGLKKFLKPGDVAFLYFSWYGLTRVIMEQMRDSNFIMNNLWSFIWAIVFLALGVLAVVGNHLLPLIFKKPEAPVK